MAPHKPNSDSVQEPDLSSTDIGGATATEPQGSHRGTSSVTCYDNGLLNLEKTPAHLISIVQSNAESPLLRLPREIRDLIWKFACGGHYITTWPHSQPRGAPKIPYQALSAKRLYYSLYGSWPPEHKLSAFGLPRVCRQIYSETALTAFKESVFCIDNQDDLRMIETFTEAQRSAIIALNPEHIIRDMVPKPTQLNLWLTIGVREVLPNFRKLYVTQFAMNHTYLHCAVFLPDSMSKEDKGLIGANDRQAWFLRRYTGILDAGIEIIFQD